MKYLASAVSVLLLSASLSYGYNAWGLYASYWDTSDADSAGGAGIKVLAEMVPGVQLELRGTYFEDLERDGLDVEVLPVEAGLALEVPLADDVGLLAGGGLGYYLMDGDGDPDNEIGFYLASGLEWTIRSNAALFGELMYRVVSADDVGPDGEDADLDGLGINVGLLIKW